MVDQRTARMRAQVQEVEVAEVTPLEVREAVLALDWARRLEAGVLAELGVPLGMLALEIPAQGASASTAHQVQVRTSAFQEALWGA